jgi:hypothetical protein
MSSELIFRTLTELPKSFISVSNLFKIYIFALKQMGIEFKFHFIEF